MAYFPPSGNSASGSDVVLSVAETAITSTSNTTILTYTPTATANFTLSAYLELSASTGVTMAFSWNDSGGGRTVSQLNSITLPAGAYCLAPVPITAKGGTAVSVTVTVSVANQVKVSSTLRKG